MVASHPPQDEAPGPFDGLDDRQVLARAEAALRAVHAAPLVSIERSIQWAVYEQCAAELNVRAWRFALWKIHERENGTGS